MTRSQGRIFVHPRGFGFLEIEGVDTAPFVAPSDLRPFVAGDLVSATVERSDKGLMARDLQLVARDRRQLFGELAMARGDQAVLKADRNVSNADWPVIAGGAPIRAGDFAVGEIAGDRVRVTRVVPPAEAGLYRLIARHDLRVEYPPEALAEANADARRKAGAHRRDLRAMTTVTIDAASTRDIDDALAVVPAGADGALRLFVSIADVDEAVPDGSALDVEARARGTSVYLADRVLPMLPPELSEDRLSLLEGADRAAMTVELRIDGEGAVTSIDVYESLIRSTARLTYDAVARLLDANDAGHVPAEVVPTLRWLRTAAARISAVRQSRGGVSLEGDEVHVTIDEQTREPLEASARPNTSAHVLVERLMVVANEEVARWLVDRGLPGVFRVHDAPDEATVRELASVARNFGFEAGFSGMLTPRGLAAFEAQFRGTPVSPAMHTVLGRALGPARYTARPSLHFGLAAPLYLHFTSPIRRYADLAVHRILKAFLRGRREFLGVGETLDVLADHLNERHRVASRAERERTWMLTARLFASRIGERARGNVVSIEPFGIVVQLQGSGVTGTIGMDALPGGPFTVAPGKTELVGAGRRYAIGEPLEVQVAGANEALGRIELALA
jgi:ribonuclease R